MKTLNLQLKHLLSLSIFTILMGWIPAQASEQLPQDVEAVELRFAEFKCNVLDFHKNVLYTAQNDLVKYYFLKDGISIRMPEGSGNANMSATVAESTFVGLKWEGINNSLEVVAAEELKIRRNAKDCVEKQYRKLFYNQLYPGIDLMYADRADQLELDFLVEAGFHHEDIKLRIDGAQELLVDGKGRLLVKTAQGDVVLDKPMAQQDGKPLAANWTIDGNQVSISMTKVDPTRATHIMTHVVQKEWNL